LTSKLQAVATQHGVTIEYLYNDIDAYGLDRDDFALLRGFKGNQKDPLGSWSFLFDADVGEMARFRPEVEPLFSESLSIVSLPPRRHSSRSTRRSSRVPLSSRSLLTVTVHA